MFPLKPERNNSSHRLPDSAVPAVVWLMVPQLQSDPLSLPLPLQIIFPLCQSISVFEFFIFIDNDTRLTGIEPITMTPF